jgi:hypothetical protein
VASYRVIEYTARAAVGFVLVAVASWFFPSDAAAAISFASGALAIIFVGAFALMTKR